MKKLLLLLVAVMPFVMSSCNKSEYDEFEGTLWLYAGSRVNYYIEFYDDNKVRAFNDNAFSGEDTGTYTISGNYIEFHDLIVDEGLDEKYISAECRGKTLVVTKRYIKSDGTLGNPSETTYIKQ